jgi:regulator of replication initiation timing
MEPSKLSERVEEWRQAYEHLTEISMQQLKLLKEAGTSDLWERLAALSSEKESLQAEIERLQSQLGTEFGTETMRELFQKQIRTIAESARVLTFEASRRVEEMMISTGEEIGSTRHRRKAFNAYSGYTGDSEISLYFDERK